MRSRRPVANCPATHTPAVYAKERGYVLLTLIFFVAVLAISLATILPSVIQEAKRDRENELVHRGAQYTRAIRLYFKKNGRYPAKIEDLEDTNNLRFLRKRYKDPMGRGENGGEADFKILRFGDPNVRLQQPGLALPGGQGPQALGQPAQPGSTPVPVTATQGRPRGTGAPNTDPSDDSSDPNQATTAAPQDENGNSAPTPPAESTGQARDSSASGTGGDKQTYGGGAMVGVASLSTKNSIREFNQKHHYNEWQFLYDPQSDRGGLPSGPWQPPKFLGQAGTGQQPGVPASQVAGSSATSASQPSTPSSEPAHDPQQHDPQQ